MWTVFKKSLFALCLFGLMGTTGSNSFAASSKATVTASAQTVSAGVGVVKKSSNEGTRGPVYVFEEVHTSRIGQLQIATMLLRLHDKYGLKNIGLEGGIWSGHALKADWYRNLGGAATKDEAEDVAVQLVAQGEFSSSELMAMLFPDIHVFGLEDALQYQESTKFKGSPELGYLLAISEKSISEGDMIKVETLLKEKNTEKALDLMLNADPWVKAQYDSLKASSTLSSEQMANRLRGIQDKARRVGASVSPQVAQDLASELHFFTTASARSDTMVKNTIQVADDHGGFPAAMIVGAAHADRVVSLLTQKGVSFALIRPIDLDSKEASMTTAEYERKVEGKWARNRPGTLGHVLNSQRKPPPVVERVTGQSYASMQYASLILARRARSGGSFPGDVLLQLAALPGFRIDKQSLEKDGNDVIFHAWLMQDDGREKQVWARVGTVPFTGTQTLEQKLKNAIQTLKGGGGGGKDGGGGVHKTHSDDEELPEGPDSRLANDIEHDGTTITRVGIDALAVFGSSREEVRKIGEISTSI